MCREKSLYKHFGQPARQKLEMQCSVLDLDRMYTSHIWLIICILHQSALIFGQSCPSRYHLAEDYIYLPIRNIE